MAQRGGLQANALEDLQEKIRSCNEEMIQAPPGHANRPEILKRLCPLLRERYYMTWASEDLDDAILHYQEAIVQVSCCDNCQASRLNNLSLLLASRYNMTGLVTDLDESVERLQESINMTPSSDPDHARHRANLGSILHDRYKLTSKLEDLEKSIQISRRAIAAMPPNDIDRLGVLTNLGLALRDKFKRTGTTEDLKEAIESCQKSVDATPPGHLELASRLNNLGITLGDRYNETGRDTDLEEAIRNCRKSVDFTPSHHPDRPMRQNNLGVWLLQRHYRTGSVADFEEALRLSQKTLEGMQSNQPDRPMFLNNVGNALMDQYRQTGKVTDLEASIYYSEQAVKATPADDPNRPLWLINLSSRWSDRYHRFRELEDLENAIRTGQQALDALHPGHHDRPGLLCNSGILLGERYDRLQEPDDLKESIDKCEEAMNLVPPDHQNRGQLLGNLSVWLRARYERYGSPVDLERSISSSEEAIKRTPPDQPSRTSWLRSLSTGLLLKYKKTTSLGDLEEAILHAREAATATPDSRAKANMLSHLASCLHYKYRVSNSPEDFNHLVDTCSAVTTQENADPIVRVRAFGNLGGLFLTKARWAEASVAFESAINLLPHVSPRTLPRSDQQYILSELAGLASDAAAAALQADKPASTALALLESGHCIIYGFAMNARSDLSDLREKDSGLCEEYEKLRDELSSYGTRHDLETERSYLVGDRSPQKVLAELNTVEAKIRCIPGLERFQLPPEPKEFMELAAKGPIITFNISRLRCDAIIVTPNRIWGRRLDHLTYDSVHAKAQSISAVGTRSRRNVKVRVTKGNDISEREQLRRDLRWLWKSAVLPALEECDVQKSHNVWWVTGGSMGLLPIHAAGDHSEGSVDNTMSRNISSYTPTFKALRYSRDREMIVGDLRGDRLMFINMANTPGHEALITKHEIEAVRQEFGQSVIVLDHPTKEDVLKNLEHCNFAHFACHGLSDPHDPSKGGIVLVENGKAVLLRISELDNVKLRNAEIAYLSACSTAEMADGELVDEAIHLSNSFQMIGFKHVVGTMWGADDYAAGEVARMFYGNLLHMPKKGDRRELEVAKALHDAVMAFRNLPHIREDIAKWGPFIHIGL